MLFRSGVFYFEKILHRAGQAVFYGKTSPDRGSGKAEAGGFGGRGGKTGFVLPGDNVGDGEVCGGIFQEFEMFRQEVRALFRSDNHRSRHGPNSCRGCQKAEKSEALEAKPQHESGEHQCIEPVRGGMDIGLVFRGLEEDGYDSFTINMKNEAKTISLSCFISGLMGVSARGSCERGKGGGKEVWVKKNKF